MAHALGINEGFTEDHVAAAFAIDDRAPGSSLGEAPLPARAGGETAGFDLPSVTEALLDPETALLEYVVAEDKTCAWLWQRAEDGFPAKPDVFEDREATITIAALNLTLPMRDIFAHVEV